MVVGPVYLWIALIFYISPCLFIVHRVDSDGFGVNSNIWFAHTFGFCVHTIPFYPHQHPHLIPYVFLKRRSFTRRIFWFNAEFVVISFEIFSYAWITVVWSRFPIFSPIAG